MTIITQNIDKYKYLLFLSIIILLSSCQATSFLKEDETFLRKNRIKFESQEKIDNKIILTQELSTLYEQVPNESIVHVPRQWFYYVNQNKKGRISNYVKKHLQEKPSIFITERTNLTANKFESFLRNNRGFYEAKVDYKVYNDKKTTDVDYIIHTGKRYLVGKINYKCEDSIVCDIIKNNSKDSYLVTDNPINSQDYNLEKTRITNLLQNKGYALFNQNSIELYGDSTNYRVDLIIKINNKNDNINHKKYKIGKIEVFTDYYPTQNPKLLDSTIINNIIFYNELDNYLVKPSILAGVITFEPGKMYQKKKHKEIYNKLSEFRIYRFISIKTEIDTSYENTLNYRIQLYTNEQKYYSEGNLDLKYVTFTESGQFIEVGANGSFYNRRLTSKGDNLNFTASGDIKINLQNINQENRNYSELNVLSKLDYINPISPKTMIISPLYLYYSGFKKKSYGDLKHFSKTNASIAYQYQTIIDNIIISSINFSYGYNYSPSKNLNIYSNQIGINYYAPEILNDSLFSTFQKKSMNNVFITGLLMKNIAININSNPKQKLYSYKLLLGLEMSGLEMFLANKGYNLISNNDDFWNLSSKVSYAKFVKANIEYRPKYQLGKNSLLAGRIYSGIGIPFGDSDVLPYIKQFEVGGPYSMRAWAARELGPGSYIHNSATEDEFPYQKGDIRLEANLEYRFKLSHYFKSALFVDAGNIWTLRYDQEREGGQFGKNFYKQIGVNAGVSLQLDVIVLIRLDLAYKLRNPYVDDDGSYWGFDLSKPSLVFAIDHPF